MGTSGKIQTTNNGGSSWTAQTSGTPQQLFSVYFTSATQGWAVGAAGTIRTTNNGGSSWTAQTSGTSQFLRSVYFTNTAQGRAVGTNGTILLYGGIPTPPCTPTTGTFTVTACSSYTWVANGNKVYTTSNNTDTIHLTNAGGCDSLVTLNLTITTPLPVSVSINTAATTVCSNVAVTFTATGSNGGTAPVYQWKKNGADAGTGTSISFAAGTLNNKDSVWCVLTSNSTCVSGSSIANSNKIKMTVNAAPAIGTSTGGIICTIGGTRQIYNSNTNGGGVWTTDNAAVATVTTAAGATGTATAIGNGLATMTYTKTNPLNGCKSFSVVSVRVAVVDAPASIAGTSVCKGGTSTLTDATIGGYWKSFATSIATIDSVTGVVTGKYQGTATINYIVPNSYGCKGVAALSLPVIAIPAVPTIGYAVGNTVNPQANAIPTTAFCNNKTFSLAGTPAGGTWSSTNNAVVTVTSGGVASTVGVGTGSVVYTYTDANGCKNSRSVVGTVVACPEHKGANSNEQLVVSNDFTMFPNPAKSMVSLQINKLIGSGSIVVTDLYGKQVKIQALSMGNNTVDVANLGKGFYLVNIITSEGKTTKKLIVE